MQMVAVMLPTEKRERTAHQHLPQTAFTSEENPVFPGIRNDVKVQGVPTWRHFWRFS
jgi:hypothetical protein